MRGTAAVASAVAWRDWLAAGGARRPFADHWQQFVALDRARGLADPPVATWEPAAGRGIGVDSPCRAGRLAAALGLDDFSALHRWSVAHREAYWAHVVAELGVVFARPPDAILDASTGGERARWLPGARLNVIDSCLAGDPGRPAVLAGGEDDATIEVTSRAELARLVDRVVLGLRARGLEPGDAVALYLPMNLACVAAYLGVVKAGMRVVSIAESFPVPELARRLAIGDARLVIASEQTRRGGRELDLYGVVCEAAAPQAVVVGVTGRRALRPGDLAWEDFLGDERPAAGVEADPDAVTNVLFSSGTTGTPKAIPWTQLTPLKAAADARFHHDVGAGDVVAWPTSVGWMMGPWLIYATLLNGAAMALYEGTPGGAGFCRFVGDAGVSVLGVVPSLVRAWRASSASDGVDWSRLRVFSSTGEASNREDMLWLTAQAGYRAPVVEYCGGTEIGGGYVTGSLLQPASPGTFTTPALGLDLVRLGQGGRPVGIGEPGEVFLVGPSIGLSQRLLNADHHAVYHAGCPPGPDGEPLRRHGDVLVGLQGGFLRAEGRADDAMNLGGIKVSALELERAVAVHPAVHEVAAVAVRPAGEGAEALVLFVVPSTPDVGGAALRADLQALLAGELNPLFRIHDLVLVGELPRTASNKVMRRTLRDGYRRVS